MMFQVMTLRFDKKNSPRNRSRFDLFGYDVNGYDEIGNCHDVHTEERNPLNKKRINKLTNTEYDEPDLMLMV